MDLIPSHVFWTWAASKFFKEKTKKPLSVKLAIFWGMFPDLFAFSFPIALLFIELLIGKISFSDLPGVTKIEPPQQNFNSIIQLVSLLYSTSHSFVIFFAAAIIRTLALYLKRKNSAILVSQLIPLEMGGWALHILIDIPTHASQFYSTPFLWPISDIKFSGIPWGTPWFLALNYFIMIIVYFKYLRKKRVDPQIQTENSETKKLV